MNKRISIQVAILSLLFSCLIAFPIQAQQAVIDSLVKLNETVSDQEKPVILAELARVNFERDPKKAFEDSKVALIAAKKQKNKEAQAFCYATVGYFYVQRHQEGLALKYIDSAVQLSEKLKPSSLTAFAVMRKGWYDLVIGDNEKAIRGFLKADQLMATMSDKRALSYKTLLNHYIASIYAYGSDTLKQRRYAQKSLYWGRKSGKADDLQLGYMSLAHSNFSAFEQNKNNRSLLDSSISYYKMALSYYETNKAKIYIQSNASVMALNVANSYFKYYPIIYEDSAKKYINLALGIARKTNGSEVIANCYGMLSEYALRNKNFEQAEQYLITGSAELANASSGVNMTRSRLMLGLAQVAEQSGNQNKALSYYKQYMTYYNKVFDAEKLAIVQRMEEQYHAAQQETEIAALKAKESYHSRLNWLYIAIGSSCIIALALMLTSYHYKLKSTQRQKMLSEQQIQEAELLARLKEEESAKLQAEQALLQDRTEWLERELMAGTLRIEEKNAILELLRDKTRQTDAIKSTRQLSQLIKQNLRMDKHQEEHQQLWNEISPSFFSKLQQQAHNSLTKLDLKYCAYILMGLDNKEMSVRLGVEPKSIRMAKYRIKQKLNLAAEENLDHFVIQSDQKNSASEN